MSRWDPYMTHWSLIWRRQTAPAVRGGEAEQEEVRKDLALAGKMDQQIEEATVFMLSLEIL